SRHLAGTPQLEYTANILDGEQLQASDTALAPLAQDSIDRDKESTKAATLKPIRVRSSFDRQFGKIQWSYLGGAYEHYKVRVCLACSKDQLDRIQRVTYKLHPDFKESPQGQNRTSTDKDTKFSIAFWTYEGFPLTATLYFIDGTKETIKYTLVLRLPKD